MAYTPPIKRRELGKLGVFDDEVFYRELSERCGYVDPETAKRFYIGLVKLITYNLREKGVVRLPHLGDFAIVPQKKRSVLIGKTRKTIEGLKVLKFYPLEVWRKYFNAQQ